MLASQAARRTCGQTWAVGHSNIQLAPWLSAQTAKISYLATAATTKARATTTTAKTILDRAAIDASSISSSLSRNYRQHLTTITTTTTRIAHQSLPFSTFSRPTTTRVSVPLPPKPSTNFFWPHVLHQHHYQGPTGSRGKKTKAGYKPDSPRRKQIKRAIWMSLGLGAAGLVVAMTNDEYRHRATIISAGAFRSLVTFCTGVMCMTDYKILHLRYMNEGYTSETYKAERRVVHQRCADRLLALCRLNTGIYTKAGQHISSLNYIVPLEYTNTLSVLQDRAPFKSIKEVEQVFREEFSGKTSKDLFKEFDPIPMAAASLAQVHKATTHDGRIAAVKVQYKDVSRLFTTDMWTMQSLSDLASFVFPEFELSWIVNEFKENLTAEFDFGNEARNSEATKERFKNKKDFYIPEIYWDLSSKKILTMEFIDGVKVNDLEGLERLKVSPKWVRICMLEVFAEMMYQHGSVHCDPHAGNILISRDPVTKKERFVLLDHGLYRDLDETFRYNYCQMWRALILNDQELLAESSGNIGIPENFLSFLPLIFIQRPVNSNQKIGEGMTTEQRQNIRSTMKNVTMAEVFEFLEILPRDMLLIFRTINLTRGIHQQLGGENVERFHINALYATMGKWAETRQEISERHLKLSIRRKELQSSETWFRWIRLPWFDYWNKTLGLTKNDFAYDADERLILKKLGLEPKDRWYLFGDTPTFQRSMGYLYDGFTMRWRLWVAENILRLWLWWTGSGAANAMN